mgnify:CR=1|jgi:hypothetical protein
MSFFAIILIIILAGYFFIRLIPWLLALKIRSMQRRQQPPETTGSGRSRKKHIRENTGDYVDYEEIEDR